MAAPISCECSHLALVRLQENRPNRPKDQSGSTTPLEHSLTMKLEGSSKGRPFDDGLGPPRSACPLRGDEARPEWTKSGAYGPDPVPGANHGLGSSCPRDTLSAWANARGSSSARQKAPSPSLALGPTRDKGPERCADQPAQKLPSCDWQAMAREAAWSHRDRTEHRREGRCGEGYKAELVSMRNPHLVQHRSIHHPSRSANNFHSYLNTLTPHTNVPCSSSPS